MTERIKLYFYLSEAERAEWNKICAYIRNHKNFNAVKNMRIAPDRASTTRVYYEKQLEREGVANGNI